MLFPGTGFPHDLGGPDAQGSAVNVALPPGTADAGWLRAFHAVVPPSCCASSGPRCWSPSTAATPTSEDPLAHLMLTVDGQRASYVALHDLAHEVAGGGGWPSGGGGYALVEVVPRAWTHLLAIVGGRPLDPMTDTPDGLARPRARPAGPHPAVPADRRAELAWRDWSEGYDPETWLDRAIHATRTEIFPFHGLDPLP